MKKRKVLGILFMASILAVTGLTGCSTNGSSTQESEKQTANQEQSSSKATEEEIAEAAKIEIEDLEEITDWEKMAEIELGDKIKIDGEGIKEEDNILTITKGGEYFFTGTLENGRIVVNTEEDVKLTLSGVTISSKDGPAIYGENSNSIYVSTEKGTENTLSDGTEYEDAKAALFSNDDLILTGEGTLKITGNYKHAICSDDMIYMESGTIQIVSAVKDGFHANDGICVDGGSIEVKTAHDALESEGAFVVNGGELVLTAEDDGLVTLGNMDINGGTIQILACEEGLEAKNALIVNDGTIEITANDDGLNAGNDLQICGGKIFTEVSKGDGLDSNGSLTISGGLTVAMGAQLPEGGIDCDEREVVITGGTLIACGGTNSAPSESESSRVSVLLGSAKAGDTIGILDEDGNTVFAFEAEKEYSNMLLSRKTIEEGKSYTVYTGGTIEGKSSFHGYYSNALYSGGEESESFTADSMVVSAGGTSDSGMQGGKGGPGSGKMEKPDGEGITDGEVPQGQMPEGEEPPEGMEIPEGEEPPEGMEKPDGDKPSQNSENRESQKSEQQSDIL